MAGNAEISWPHLRMRIEDNASFAHGFRILRYTGLKIANISINMHYENLLINCYVLYSSNGLIFYRLENCNHADKFILRN